MSFFSGVHCHAQTQKIFRNPIDTAPLVFQAGERGISGVLPSAGVQSFFYPHQVNIHVGKELLQYTELRD